MILSQVLFYSLLLVGADGRDAPKQGFCVWPAGVPGLLVVDSVRPVSRDRWLSRFQNTQCLRVSQRCLGTRRSLGARVSRALPGLRVQNRRRVGVGGGETGMCTTAVNACWDSFCAEKHVCAFVWVVDADGYRTQLLGRICNEFFRCFGRGSCSLPNIYGTNAAVADPYLGEVFLSARPVRARKRANAPRDKVRCRPVFSSFLKAALFGYNP